MLNRFFLFPFLLAAVAVTFPAHCPARENHSAPELKFSSSVQQYLNYYSTMTEEQTAQYPVLPDSSRQDRENRARELHNRGMRASSRDENDRALTYYRQALKINKELARKDGIAKNLSGIGSIHHAESRYDKALHFYQQALKINRQIDNKVDIAQDLNNIGQIYQSWGQFERALSFYQQALQIDEQLGIKVDIAQRLHNMGGSYADLGQIGRALDSYQRALAINKELHKNVRVTANLIGIGLIYSSRKQFDRAMEYFQKALSMARASENESIIATLRNNIGMVYHYTNQYDRALEQYQLAQEINLRLNREASQALLYSNIGLLYADQGQYEQAIESYKKSIRLKEKIRRTAPGDIRRDYLASQLDTYQFLATACLKNNDPKGVIDAIEQSRARLLAEQLATDGHQKTATAAEIQAGLAADEAVLVFANIEQNRFILMVITDQEIAMEEIAKNNFLIKSKRAYKKPLLMLLEKKRGLKVIPDNKDNAVLPDNRQQEDFTTAIHYYRQLLTDPKRVQETKEFASLLYSLLIEPVRDKLAGKTRLTIMPDGILAFLPFETLRDNQNRYLAEQYSLGYTQSLTITALLRARDYTEKTNRKPLLAMGGAVYEPVTCTVTPVTNSRQLASLQAQSDRILEEKRSARSIYGRLGLISWPELPGTLREVNDISATVQDTDLLTGDKVSENRIKAYSRKGKLADYRILHFATHGLVVQELPELSAIVLSQFQPEKNNEDGYLRMSEIARLSLAADFVNLSACETGLGSIYRGEGVVGLTQSFLIAGANGLSVSLWQVADDSTARFMAELYKKEEHGGMTFREAVTEVKRQFINGDFGKQWQSPFYWSPFVYYGK